MSKLILSSLGLLLLASQAYAAECRVPVTFDKGWVNKEVAVKRCIDVNCQVTEDVIKTVPTEATQTINVPCYEKPQSLIVVPSGSTETYYSQPVTVTSDKPVEKAIEFSTTRPKNVEIETETKTENGVVKEEERKVEVKD